MFVAISNTPRDYAWGSSSAIAGLLGTEPSGGPEAELWLGGHPGSPSRIADPAVASGASDLAAWIAADAEGSLGAASVALHGRRLPFLLKVLAAAGPLSLQAHPSPEQARAGFERENAAGLAADDAARNYKDPFHKPELIVAVSETFDALCGFRTVDGVRAIVAELLRRDIATDAAQPAALAPLVARIDGEDPLRRTVEWLLRGGRGDVEVAALVARVVELAGLGEPDADAEHAAGFEAEFGTVHDLAHSYPGDPGIVLSLLLNRVTLRAGEALYLPAGNIHAYLRGLGIELMAASDNVLRGGLTPKHIDVDELLSVLDFSPVLQPRLEPETPQPGVRVFRPDVPDFMLYEIDRADVGASDAPDVAADAAASVPLAGPAIALCTAGDLDIVGSHGSSALRRGDSVYITADEGTLRVTGAGTLFIATTNTASASAD